MFQTNVLHIARLTDPPKSVGKGNLTLRNLPDLVSDKKLKDQLTALLDAAEKATSFCRDWRNRRFAHYALDLATDASKATALEAVNKDKVNAALKSLADVLNALERHYFQGGTVFEAVAAHNGAVSLLYVLGDGIKRKQEREELMESGKISEADLPELM